MPKHTLIKLLLASMGFTCSMLAREKTKNKEITPEMSTTRLPEIEAFSINVPENAKISHLHVVNTAHLDGHLDVDNDVSIENHLYVGGSQENNKHLNVSGNQHNDAKITVDKNSSFKEKIIVKDNVILKNNLFVNQDTVLKKNEIIHENLRVKLDLAADDDASINHNTLVEGIIHAENNLNVDQNMYVKGYQCIGKNLTVKGSQLIEETATVNKNVMISGQNSIDGNHTVGGNIILKGDLGLAGDLQISGTATLKKGINVNEDVNISGNLSVAGHSCIDGSICVDKMLKAPIITTDILTTNTSTIQNANLSGTLFVNEINPLTDECETTKMSGDVMIDRAHKLFVHLISPTPDEETSNENCSCQEQSLCSQSVKESSITLLAGSVGFESNKVFLVNEINPVTKGACNNIAANDQGTTFFGGNVGISPSKEVSNAKKLLANHIDPVQKNECGMYVYNHAEDAAICFGGNVAIMDPLSTPTPEYGNDYYAGDCNPFSKKLLTNTISPVVIDPTTQACSPDQSLDALTCFSGNVAISNYGQKALHTNYIDPVTTDTTSGKCIKDTSPCAQTSFSGNMSIKNGHYFGQFDYDCNTNDYGYQVRTQKGINDQGEYVQGLCLNCDRAEPVIRLTFNNIDPQQEPFPQGAWVKLNILGKMRIDEFVLDVFSQLYFFVGPGFNAPCSSFAGTINSVHPAVNTLSGTSCISEFTGDEFYHYQQFPFIPNLPTHVPSKFLGHTLFESMPQAIGSQALFTLLGTTASSSDQKNIVDILLVAPLFFQTACVFMSNMSIFYEIISPNLDANNPPCLPNPRLDETIYNEAYEQLLFKFFRELAPAPAI